MTRVIIIMGTAGILDCVYADSKDVEVKVIETETGEARADNQAMADALHYAQLVDMGVLVKVYE